MKRFMIGVAVVCISVLAACNSWIDPDMNKDPNTPTDATMDAMLPSIQAGASYALGGDLGRYSSFFTQHSTGVDRQSKEIYEYDFSESDVDNAWRFNLYGGPMNDLDIMMDKATASNSPHYLGIAQIMMAHLIGTVTDLWGDVPYSNAFGGASNLQPAYDTQEQIYTAIQTMLDQGIANCGAAASSLSPSDDDMMFGGDMSLWIKAAYSLKARYALHLLERDANSATKALSFIANAMAANADDMQFTFGTLQSEANPMYQFVVQRDGDMTFGVKLSEIMNANADPRLPFYAEQDDSGTYTSNSRVGPFFASISSAVPWVTNAEVRFIEAEAMFRTGNPSEAHRAYMAAIRASLERTGVAAADVDAYLAKPDVDPGVSGLTLNHVMTQKYIAMYLQAESYTDWRRTDLPALTSVVQGKEIPRRFPYAQSERLYNGANVPPGQTINTRVWWDMP